MTYCTEIYFKVKELSQLLSCSKEKSFELIVDYIANKTGISGALYTSTKEINNIMSDIDISLIKKDINFLSELYIMIYDDTPNENEPKKYHLVNNTYIYVFVNCGLGNYMIDVRKNFTDSVIIGFTNDIICYKINLLRNHLYSLNNCYMLVSSYDDIDISNYINNENKWFFK